jgi:large repetitive protein
MSVVVRSALGRVLPAFAFASGVRGRCDAVLRALLCALVAVTLLAPQLALAASSGCAAVNAHKLDMSGTFTSGNLGSTTGARFWTNVSDQAINALNISATSDPAAGTAAYDGSTYTFATGDVINYSVSVTGYAASGSLVFNIRNGDSATTITNPVSDTFTGDGTRPYTYTVLGGETSIGLRIGKSATPSGTFSVTATCTAATPPPVVNALSPTAGPTAGGNTVVLTGSGFTGATAVSFGANAATAVTVSSDTQITATAPSGSAGTTNVTVTTGGGTSATAASNQYTYVAAPTITATAPTAGPTTGGSTVILSGTNLGGTTAVTFGATPAINFTINSNTQITATAPSGSGTVNVRATTAGGTSATAAANQFTYVVAPAITAIAPTAGPTTGGTAVVITGTNFSGATAVTFGGTAATNFTVNSATQITATAPSGAGTVDVRVTTVGGTSPTNAADQFTYVAAPTVTSVAPSVGSTGGGTGVVITGTNFSGATGVSFDGTAASGFTVNSATQITANYPAHAAGPVNVQVTTAGGTSATGSGNQFTYGVTPAAPVLVAPANGATVGSTTPTYAGTADANTTITIIVDGASIGTTTADGSGNWARTQPTALSTGSHSVRAEATNAQGLASPSSNTNTFTVTPAPVANNYTLPVSITYNAGANTPTAFSVAGQVSNNPTSYAVGSATTANGGTVAVSNSGVVTYTAARGFRGSDAFSYTASNPGGTSAPGTVTVTVGDPTLSSTLAGSGTRGIALSGVRITTTGGAAPYSCGTTLASGALPAGTQLNADCSVSGTPNASGSFTFTANVTDSSTGTGPFTQATNTLSLTVAAPTLSLSPAAGALPGATAGTSYSQAFTTNGGTAPYAYAITAGALPPGLSLSGAAISGTPSQTGTYNFTVRATDSANAGSGGPYTVSNSYSITVSAPTIALSPATLTNATAGATYSATIAASGGTSPYTYDVVGTLPAGLSLSTGGALTGIPTVAGTFNFTVRATDSTAGGTYSGTQAYTLVIERPAITLSPTTLAAGTVGTPYSATASANGGTAPYSYSITGGALPAGLTLGSDGALTGTPTAGGNFNFTVTATDSTGGSGPFAGSRAYALRINSPVVLLTPTTLTNATAGVAVSQSVSASGGTAPYSYAVTAGALPAGLSLASDGTLTGTPTAGGTFNFTVTATDSSTGSGAPYSGSRAYTLTVNPATITVGPATLPNARAGTAYNQTITALGGNGAYSFAVTAGALPAGWTLSSTGLLSGTATAADATYNFTITATDQSTGNGPFSGSRSYSVSVLAPNFSLTPPALSATVGQPYTGTFVASGGTAPYSYMRTGTLPPGLTLASDGTLSGTPSAGGTFNFTIIARDSTTGAGGPYQVGSGYSFTVGSPALALDPATLGNGTVGATYSETVSASGGTAPYSYAVTSGALPAGLSLDTASGAISGTPTAGGSFNFTIAATDSSTGVGAPYVAARSYALTIDAATIAMTPASLPAGTPGAAYSQALTASGGTPAYSFAITAGTLPPGLSLASGTISGTPTASGTYTFTVAATDSSTGSGAPYAGSRTYTLVIGVPTIAVDTATLPNATVAASYSQSIAASGGTGPYSYAVTGGALPAGMTLNSTGQLSGTPTAGGTFNFTVTATDSSGGAGPFSGSRALRLVVGAPTIALAPAAVSNAVVGTAYSQAITATGGVGGYSYAVTAGALPAGVALATDGTLAGTPTAAGTFNFTVTATDSATGSGPFTGSRAYALTVGAATLALAPATIPDAVVGSGYSSAIAATGGTAPYRYAVTAGALPAGVTLSTSGTLSGTPTSGGSFNFTVTATDSSTGAGAPFGAQRSYALTVAAPAVALTPATLPAGQMEASYSQALSAGGGTAPHRYAVTAGALPPGLTLASNGTLAGTPSVNGTFNFTVTATDSSTGSGPYSGSRAYSLVIAPPNVPSAGAVSATVGYGSAANAIAPVLSGGAATSIAVASPPAHGTVTVSGLSFSYTPASGYYGADSFTYTASNAGGTSAPGTVSITVSTPAAPTAADVSGPAVPYNSSGTAIDLSTAITGVRASIAVASAPAHGTVAVAGDVVTYTPTTGYYGADSFTYTATGPGGTSAPATVRVTVATPAAPVAADVSNVAVPYAGSGTAIDLSGAITGVHASIAIVTAPQHGTVSIAGDVVTYVPAATYHGADSFTYAASGPGGTSAPAAVTLSVANPPAPSTAPASTTVASNSTTSGASVQVNLSAQVSGVYDSIQITRQPAHGTVTLSGVAGPSLTPVVLAPSAPTVATYTPDPNFVGTDSFAFVAVGPGGTSAPATVTITVVGQAPVATPKTATAGDGETVSVLLTDNAQRGPFTGATVLGVSPANAATATVVAAGNGSYRLDVTPSNRFGGQIVIAYTLTNAYGVSAPSTVTVTTQARPDPRTDPNVTAISDAQAETTRRFGRAQVSNFLRRTEQLHNGGGATGMKMGVSLSSRDGSGQYRPRPGSEDWSQALTERMRLSGEDPQLGRLANDPQSPLSRGEPLGYGRTIAADGAASAPNGTAGWSAAEDAGDGNGARRIGSVASWVGGAIDIGTRDRRSDRSKITATTAGLSAGADIKLSDGVLIGLGGGYGDDLSEIGTAARMRGTSTLFAAYASVQPVGGAFVDGMVGRGWLDFTTRRLAAGTSLTAIGKRDGSYDVAALSLGIDRRSGGLNWSLYGRGEYLGAELGGYAETGADRFNLRFDPREVRSVSGTLGGRIEYGQKVDFGMITPRLRAEWSHEFADVDAQWLDYANIPGEAIYAIGSSGWKREQFQLTLGTRIDLMARGWSFDMETGVRGGQGERSGTVQVRASTKF